MLICSFGKTHLTSWTQIRELSTHSSWWRYFDLNRKNRFGVENSILNRGRTSLVLCPKARIQKLSLHRLAQQPPETLVAAGHTSKLLWKFIKLDSARNSCSKLNRGLEGSKWKTTTLNQVKFQTGSKARKISVHLELQFQSQASIFEIGFIGFRAERRKSGNMGGKSKRKSFSTNAEKKFFVPVPRSEKATIFRRKLTPALNNYNGISCFSNFGGSKGWRSWHRGWVLGFQPRGNGFDT